MDWWSPLNPEPLRPPSSGGLSGFAGLTYALESIASEANSTLAVLDQISNQCSQWASGTISDASFGSSIDSLLNSGLLSLERLPPLFTGILNDYNPEVYELRDLTQDGATQDGLQMIVDARDAGAQGFDAVQSLRELLGGVVGLRDDFKALLKAHLLRLIGSSGALTAVEAVLLTFADSTWDDEKPQSTTTSATSSATPSPYMMGTKEGIDQATFNLLVQAVDGGRGHIIQYDNVPFKTYIANITAIQAWEIGQAYQSILLGVVDLSGASAASALPGYKKKVRKRDTPNIMYRPGSDDHLRIISADRSLYENGYGSELPPYRFDGSLGFGQTIYILSTGYRPSHIVRQPSSDL